MGLCTRKLSLQILPVDDQADGTLMGVLAHLYQELPQPWGLGLQEGFGGGAVDDHRRIEDQLATLRVVFPDTSALWKGGGPAKKFSQDLKSSADPDLLITRLGCPVHTRNEQNTQCAFGLRGPEKLSHSRCGVSHGPHLFDAGSFRWSMILSEQKVKIVGMSVLASSVVAGPACSGIRHRGIVCIMGVLHRPGRSRESWRLNALHQRERRLPKLQELVARGGR